MNDINETAFDPTVHKVFAVDWSLTGTSFVIARDEGVAEDIASSRWSDDHGWEDALDCQARSLRASEADDADIPYGANEWGRHQLTLAAALRLIDHPQPAPQPINELRHLSDAEWLRLAASYDYTRPAICAICVRDGRSAATDGIRCHVVGREIREPGQWDILSGEPVVDPYRAFPKYEPLLAGRTPTHAVDDLAALWERLRAAREERRAASIEGVGGARVGLDPAYLMDVAIGGVDSADSSGRVLLAVGGCSDPVAIYIPDRGLSALVMPKRIDGAGAPLDSLLRTLAAEEGQQ